jgi:hypothetical protein
LALKTNISQQADLANQYLVVIKLFGTGKIQLLPCLVQDDGCRI